MSNTICSTDHGNWLEITLNRPDRLNAFNDEMHLALRAALEVAGHRDAIRAVLLTGSGRGFCAGQDLRDRDPSTMKDRPDLGHTLRTFYNPLIRTIRSLELPVVCAVNGVAAGAGANLALACDIVLAARSARFIQSFARVGLVPDAGGTWSLTHLLGPARARALAMTGEPLGAEKAAEWGLIWKAVADSELAGEARALTASLARGPTIALASTKKLIDEALSGDLEGQLEREADAQLRCGRSAEYAEGVRAFLEKRQPDFGGCSE
ncbi:MAG: 2-(1,2-epoxy-1,2-dihydrophenyl)acetyl-CoA isomerase PaaG [Geminicoccaceae bacterium]